MQAIAVMNQKGGTGKTTVAMHLAVGLHRAGRAVTLFDADPQGSANDWMLSRKTHGHVGPAVESVDMTQLERALRGSNQDDLVVIDTPGEFRPETQRGTTSILDLLTLLVVPMIPSSLDRWGAQPILDALKERRTAGLRTPPVVLTFNKVWRRAAMTTLADKLVDRYQIAVLHNCMGFRPAYLTLPEEGRTAYDLRPSAGARKEMEGVVNEIKEML